VFSKKHFINTFSAVFLLFIGALFVFKYGIRYGNVFTTAPIFYIAAIALVLLLADKKLIPFEYHFSKSVLFTVLAVILLVTFVLLSIPLQIRNGRFPAVVEWLTNFKRGFFPYGTETNPSGFPFNFFFAAPFFVLGDAGYLEVFGLSLFLMLLLKSSKTTKEFWVKFLLLICIPTTAYEIAVRSELLANTALVLSLFYLAEQRLDENKIDLPFFVLALLFGFLLSTRLIVFVWLAMFLLYFFRNNLKNGFLFCAIAVGVFVLSFLPFYFWNPAVFLQHGPFAIQSIYLPKLIFYLFPFLVFYVGWMVADFQELLFASGVLTFLLVTISFFTTLAANGFYESVFNSRFDISYYALAVPFFILALKEYKVDWFLGKVYDEKEG